MIRFAWLQTRTRTAVAAAALAALAVAAGVTGVRLASLYDRLVAHCQSSCGLAESQFLAHDHLLQNALNPLVQVVPALLGMFWGAPLVARELETGTFRLAWTQSVSRRRWLLSKLALNGLSALAVAGLLSLTVTWWYRALDAVGSNQYAVFDRRDLAPIGYAAFAFTSGVLLGAVLRRTVPAMATTLAVFVLVRVGITLWLRPHLLPPVHQVTSLLRVDEFGFLANDGSPVVLVARGGAPPGAWTLSNTFVTMSGHAASSSELAAFVRRYCPAIATPPSGGPGAAQIPPKAAFDTCRTEAARTFHLLVTYQPAGHYWPLQWIETGLFAALAVAAAGACYWWVTSHSA